VTQVIQPVDVAARARFFRSLGEPSRLAILDALRGGELRAGDIAAAAHLSASNASRHLACLRECGLVDARQDWRHVYYRLAGNHVDQLLREADMLLDTVAERVASCTRPEMEKPD
jgi:DNA-binding transcriptional ArsR family regulator